MGFQKQGARHPAARWKSFKVGHLGVACSQVDFCGRGYPCPLFCPSPLVTHHSLQPSCRRSPGARVTLAPSPEVCQQLHCSGRIQPPPCSNRPCAEGKIRTAWDGEGTTVTYVPCTMLASCRTHVCGDKVGRCSQHRSDVLSTGRYPRERSPGGRGRLGRAPQS